MNDIKDKRAAYMVVKLSVTRLWQLSRRSSVTFKQHANYVSCYVKNWSLWNELVISIKIVGAALHVRGAC